MYGGLAAHRFLLKKLIFASSALSLKEKGIDLSAFGRRGCFQLFRFAFAVFWTAAAAAFCFSAAANSIFPAFYTQSRAVNEGGCQFFSCGVINLLGGSARHVHIGGTFFLRKVLFVNKAYRFVFIDCQGYFIICSALRMKFADFGKAAYFSCIFSVSACLYSFQRLLTEAFIYGIIKNDLWHMSFTLYCNINIFISYVNNKNKARYLF